MPSPAQQVDAVFNKADGYAKAAQSSLKGFTDALSKSFYTPPTIGLTWNTPAPPALPGLPGVPVLPQIVFSAPSSQPKDITEQIPVFGLTTFTDTEPDLHLPSAPTISYGTTPVVPGVANVAVPTAPVLTMPGLPTFVQLNAVPFATVDLHDDWLAKLENIPTLTLVAPTPYSYALGPAYASQLLDNVKAKINERLAGGTGIAPAVEQQLWDRARSREVQTALANEADIMRTSEAQGFQLPSGVLAAQLREARQGYFDKLSSLSRDISIKQADLEQANAKDAIAAGMQLESQLIDYSYKLESLAFESAKTTAESALQLYTAAIEQYRVLLQGYETYASVYKTIIDGQLAKVEVYKAQLQGELAKVQINAGLVEQYKAQIEAQMSRVEIFRAQVSAAQTLVQLEEAKIGAAGEQIRAYVAQVNAETAKVEAYKAGVQAEATKIDIYKVKAEVFSAKAGAQAEYSRSLVARYSALVSANANAWAGYSAKVGAESARIEALGKQSAGLLDTYRAAAAAVEAQATMTTRVWESNIRQYEAGQTLTLQTAKVNNDAVQYANASRLDAAKSGAQVYAQLTGSAYQMMHVQASISGNAQNTVSYNYSGSTAGSPVATTSV